MVALRHKLGWAIEDIRREGTGALWSRLRARLTLAGRADRRRKADDDHSFDAQGYRTSGKEVLEELDVIGDSHADSCHYAVTQSYEFASAMAALDVAPAGYTFIDLGSGKGRVLLLAADHGFERVIGVEFARELHDIAAANIKRREELRGPDRRIELVHQDATRYVLPDAPLVLFLFSPFKPPVLKIVARNILESWRRKPRPIRVIYLNQVYPEVWLEGFEPVATSADGKSTIYAPKQAA